MNFQYCPICGSGLRSALRFGRDRPVCDDCGYIHFVQPRLAAAMLARSAAGLLLVKRDIEPKRGRWTFPSGYVDSGETPADAAVRETHEETGAVVRVDGLVGVYAEPDNPVVLVVYHGLVEGGRVSARDETQAVAFYDPEYLPELAFDHDLEIIRDWRAILHGGEHRPGARHSGA